MNTTDQSTAWRQTISDLRFIIHAAYGAALGDRAGRLRHTVRYVHDIPLPDSVGAVAARAALAGHADLAARCDRYRLVPLTDAEFEALDCRLAEAHVALLALGATRAAKLIATFRVAISR
jgi:hypothetical protein